MEALRRIAIGAPNPAGGVVQVPLAEVATIGLSSGAFYIYREQQERFIPVKFSVRGRDLGSAVLEAQQKVAEEVQLPGGYRLDWAGDFANFQNAIDRLSIAVPIAIALILLLLYVSFGTLRDTLAGGQRDPDGADRRHPGPRPLPTCRSASRPRSASWRCSASRR